MRITKKEFIATRIKQLMAFTLAEVLIVLGIIGVIAELTIPELILNVQGTQYKAGWKKAYSTLANATSSIVSDQGGSLINLMVDNNTLRNFYKDKLSWIKSCDDSLAEGCYSYTTLTSNGRSAPTDNSGQPALVLKDGTLLWFYSALPACNGTSGCGKIMVDVNGNKPPNLIGVDIFSGFIDYNISNSSFSFTPAFRGSPTYTCVPCSKTACSTPDQVTRGYYCSSEYLLN